MKRSVAASARAPTSWTARSPTSTTPTTLTHACSKSGPGVYAIATPTLDMLVEKFGQTTHHTFGEITDADLETTSTEGFSFDDQLRIDAVDPSEDWSAGGDSGSIVFAQEPTSGRDQAGGRPALGRQRSQRRRLQDPERLLGARPDDDLRRACSRRSSTRCSRPRWRGRSSPRPSVDCRRLAAAAPFARARPGAARR